MPDRLPYRPVLVFILLFTACIEIGSLSLEMWTDEQRTLYYAGAAPQYGLTTLPESLSRIGENLWQAPAYYVFLWGWGRLAGWSLIALRLPSLLFGLLTVALTYDLARQYVSRAAAFYAAFTLAFSAYFLNFWHDMRAYTLFTLLTALMLWTYIRLFRRRTHSTGLLILLCASVTGLLYTHFFAVFPVAALGLCHVLLKRKHRLFWHVLLVFITAGVLFLPWLQVLTGGAQLATEVSRKALNLSALEIGESILYFFTSGGTALGLLLGISFLRTRQVCKLTLPVLWLILSVLLLWLVTRFIPALTDVKYMLFLWSGLAIVAGSAIASARPLFFKPRWILLVWMVIFLNSRLNPAEQARIYPWYRAPFGELADTLLPLTTEQDSLLFVAPQQEAFIESAMLQYYFYEIPPGQAEVVQDTFAMSDSKFMAQADNAIRDAQRVWLTYDNRSPNWRTVFLTDMTLPDAGFTRCGSLEAGERLSVALYARLPGYAGTYPFIMDEGSMIDVSLVTEPQFTGDNDLMVVPAWSLPAEAQGQPYSLAVHLDNAQGEVAAQSDAGITQSEAGCLLQIIDLNGIPAGEYTLKFTVYDWQTGSRLSSQVPAADNRPIVGSLVIPG